jgi:hypothetical protein
VELLEVWQDDDADPSEVLDSPVSSAPFSASFVLPHGCWQRAQLGLRASAWGVGQKLTTSVWMLRHVAQAFTLPRTGTSQRRPACHLENQVRVPLAGTHEGSVDRASEHKAPLLHPEESSASQDLADC